MTNENILKEISDAIKLNNESKVTTNEALCHASNVIRSLEKKLKEEYERGCKDAWNLACYICCSTAFGGMTAERLDMVFGKNNAAAVMDNYSYENAKKKMDEFLAKEEEKNKKRNGLVIGDVVKVYAWCIVLPGHKHEFEAIFCGNDDDHYYVLSKEDDGLQRLHKDDWLLIKTGKHVDLDF